MPPKLLMQGHCSEFLCHVVQNVEDLNTGRANGYVSGQIYYDVVMVRSPSASHIYLVAHPCKRFNFLEKALSGLS